VPVRELVAVRTLRSGHAGLSASGPLADAPRMPAFGSGPNGENRPTAVIANVCYWARQFSTGVATS